MSHSLGAGPGSFRTLRPTAHTEHPIAEAPLQAAAGSRRRIAKATLLGVGAGVCLALGAWLMQQPRAHRPVPSMLVVNGSPALKKTPSGEVQRWPGDAEVTVAIDSSFDQLPPLARDAVFDAFGAWLGSGAAVPQLRFDSATGTQASLRPDGKNVVMFTPIEIPGHTNDLAITVGFSDAATGQLVEADIILNSNKKFGLVDATAAGEPGDEDDASTCGVYDVQSVVTHEAGHFFGLGEDMDERESTMYFKTGKCEVGKRQLHPSDSNTMTGLYSSPLPTVSPESSPACAAHGPPREGHSGGPTAPGLGLLIAGTWLCARRRRR